MDFLFGAQNEKGTCGLRGKLAKRACPSSILDGQRLCRKVYAPPGSPQGGLGVTWKYEKILFSASTGWCHGEPSAGPVDYARQGGRAVKTGEDLGEQFEVLDSPPPWLKR